MCILTNVIFLTVVVFLETLLHQDVKMPEKHLAYEQWAWEETLLSDMLVYFEV